MLTPDPNRFFRQLLSGLLCWVLIGGAAVGLMPMLLLPYLLICMWAFVRFLRVSCVSERFLDFASTALINWLAVCPMLGLVMGIAAFQRLGGQPQLQALGMALVPSGLTIAAYWLVGLRRKFTSPFQVRHEQVSYSEDDDKSLGAWTGGIAAALSATVMAMLGEPADKAHVALWLYGFFAVTSLYYVYYLRNAIPALKSLASQERSRVKPFIFENLPQIRAWRQRFWLARLIAWLSRTLG
ncbi:MULTISPECIES: hypothetical protein [Pseudomonas]|uniref:hypothetical protein n=1 Tax=Pseudomonas TaxID=286 RepID=UPI0023D7E59F|nr:hypothetical protein [Pseudomonas sp. 273]